MGLNWNTFFLLLVVYFWCTADHTPRNRAYQDIEIVLSHTLQNKERRLRFSPTLRMHIKVTKPTKKIFKIKNSSVGKKLTLKFFCNFNKVYLLKMLKFWIFLLYFMLKLVWGCDTVGLSLCYRNVSEFQSAWNRMNFLMEICVKFETLFFCLGGFILVRCRSHDPKSSVSGHKNRIVPYMT
jgi:hypothetical protein